MAKIAYSKSAIKALRKAPADVSRRIRARILLLSETPAGRAANVKRLEGRPAYRLRVGDWRVIFERDGDTLKVLVTRPRSGIYR